MNHVSTHVRQDAYNLAYAKEMSFLNVGSDGHAPTGWEIGAEEPGEMKRC